MKILIVGDVVGKTGLDRLKIELNEIINKENIDFCIVNGENSASGRGLRTQEYDKIMEYGADCITMGNHLYYRKEMAEVYDTLPRLLIPANITNLQGKGSMVIEKNNVKFGVINLIGAAEMGEIMQKNISSPFKEVENEIKKLESENVDYIFIDFHAEATAEKIAMGYFLDGRVTCVFGTHTHVQTADETILENGTAYITDVGMTGPKDSVIGLKKEIALRRFVNGEYLKYECSTNDAIFNGIIVEVDEKTNKSISISRINS
ncbi:MAG: TIGR00282 family metallophosphoesterase [Clostridia bacterium]|nr:TIGR00282 family metallophosphoesterase [Clostridia bacterium]